MSTISKNIEKQQLRPLNDLIAEYEKLWVAQTNLPPITQSIYEEVSVKLMNLSIEKQAVSRFQVESVSADKLTPGILLGRIKNYLADNTGNTWQRLSNISDYLHFNRSALENMCQTYKEAKPFLEALRKIIRVLVALFTGKPLKAAAQKSEAQILIDRVNKRCNEIRKDALNPAKTPTLRMG